MDLILSVLRCPDHALPETRRVPVGDFAIGRGPENDWVLSDPERVLSKRHCTLEYRGGGWCVRDLSVNGTYRNQSATPIGREQSAPIEDGDRLRFGAWEIEVRVEARTDEPVWSPQHQPQPGPYPAAWQTGGQGFQPHAEPPPLPHEIAGPARRGAAPGQAGFAPAPVGLPGFERADPMASPGAARRPLLPGEPPPLPDDGFGRPSASDHLGSELQAFTAPPLQPGAIALPDDWDLDPEPAPARPAPQLRPAGPATSNFDRPDSPVPSAVPRPMPATAAPEAAPARPATAGDAAAGLAAFLAGAGLPPSLPANADPEAVLYAAGAALHAAIAGLRVLLIGRSDVKRTFRIEQSMLRPEGNNPVKFAATEAAALTALLSGPGATAGPRAVQETVDDLAAHQVATFAATQAAARALLARLSPAALEAAENGGGLLSNKRARLWESYQKLHGQVTAQFDDNFDSAFGKEFARAYERAVRPPDLPGSPELD